MKKILLSTVFLMSFIFYSYSQVIDIVGVGTNGLMTSNLQFINIDNIDHIDVGVVKSWGGSIKDGDVIFSNFNGDGTTILHDDVINRSGFPSAPGEYATSSFSDVDASGINLNITRKNEYFQSFYSFVYRNVSSTYKSFASLETVYFYSKGDDLTASAEYIYNIPIDAAGAPRDITVKIPISELNDDKRIAIIDITAGIQMEHYEVRSYDLGNKSFFLGEYTLTNVPGNITNVSVKIYSPEPNKGDSFYVNGVVVDVDIVDDGCTYTQGYWKNHSTCKKGNGNGPKRDDTWDEIPGGEAEETIFFLSEQNYCEVFDTNPGKGGKYYILAHQYVAAQLNLLNNSNPTDVADAFNEASEFLNNHSPSDVKGNKSLEADCVRLGGILDDYNNGRIGPGHCDDDESEAQVNQTKIQAKKEVSIYPNPANNSGKISFTAKQGGTSSVELYNVSGRKVAILFNGKTKKNQEVVVEYDASAFKNGLYFTIIKNGTDIYKDKISIAR